MPPVNETIKAARSALRTQTHVTQTPLSDYDLSKIFSI